MKSAPWLICLLALLAAGGPAAPAAPAADPASHVAAKPLFRDPVYDGAADPTVIYRAADRKWYMFYTVRRANVPGLNGVGWVHGTPIGIATSADGGASWQYAGRARINYPGAVADATWWAPAVVFHRGIYHMFLTYVPGTFSDGWAHPRDIIHLTSQDLLAWDYQSTLPLSSHKVIDPGLLHLPDGTWRLWYKDEANGSSTHVANSPDLEHWTDGGRVPGLSDASGEAPLPFHWKGHDWFLRDITGGSHGLALYRSEDTVHWQRVGTLLQKPGTGRDDRVIGHHPDIIISEDRAYIFYFTHPGQAGGSDGDDRRRSSIQVGELQYDRAAQTLTIDRDAPTVIQLQPPADPETESKIN